MTFLMSFVVSSMPVSVLLFSGPPVLVISLYVYWVSCDPLLPSHSNRCFVDSFCPHTF